VTVTAPGDVLPLHVRVMGVTVAIDASDEDTRARLARQWSRAVTTEPLDEPPVARVEASPSPPDLRDAAEYGLATQVTMAALRATRGRHLNFHAGGVADAEGRVLALVAPSGTGKTTATRLLAQRLGYLSDETVSLDPDGRVYPHAKPLSVIREPDGPRAKQQLAPDDLGLQPTKENARLARLVVLRRGRPEPRGLVPLETVEGVLELVEQSSSLTDLADPLATLLRLVDGAGGVWALEYDEIEQHIDTLVDFLAADLPTGASVERARHPGRAQTSPVPEDRLARAPWRDAVEMGDEVVVLLESRAVRLDHLAASLWLELDEPLTLHALTRAAQQRHGDHPEAEELVARAVEVLTDEGLVVRAPSTRGPSTQG
jgi:hypothetical protein